MAKDDYFVIVYKILSYLYACLKLGEQPNLEYLQCNTNQFPINEIYWNNILINIHEDGYIKGIKEVTTLNEKIIVITQDISITTKGIEYLQGNSTIEKIKKHLKDIKDIIPGM